MPIKDRLVTWYISNIITPRREIIDKPGFVVTTFTEDKYTTYLREFFLPEQLFEIIENKIVEKYGEQGKQALYSAGKKFGYMYSSMSNFPTINDITEKELAEFAYLMLRYIESIYAKRAEHKLSFTEKILEITFDNYIICRHNGFGYIMMNGAISGLWAYVLQDKSVEGTQLECQGRNDKQCYFFCAPVQKHPSETKKVFQEQELFAQEFDNEYKAFNEIRDTKYAQNSLRHLIDLNFFNFQQGTLSYKGMRFFPCESHILYFLENEIQKLPNGEQILCDACTEYGKILQKTYGDTDYEQFIMDFFPALGFGELLFLDHNKPTIASIYYPWSKFSKKSKYIILRAVLSGIISNALNKEIIFTNYDVDIVSYLTLTMYP
ncbi:MAG: hypothetical protein QXX20_08265 [Candidatus Thermoplasmatota archaeon]